MSDKSWEERFDENWYGEFQWRPTQDNNLEACNCPSYEKDKVKSFIRAEIEKAKHSALIEELECVLRNYHNPYNSSGTLYTQIQSRLLLLKEHRIRE